MTSIVDQCVSAYAELKHLKLVGEKVGIPWQTVYVHLRKAGIVVTGDKARYGSIADKLANKAERIFSKTVPFAIDNNKYEFQATIDFNIGDITIDVKAATLAAAGRQLSGKKYAAKWGFCINKQRDTADFFVLYAFDSDGEQVKHVFLIPNEIATQKTTISIPFSLNSKWSDYRIEEAELPTFFSEIKEINNLHKPVKEQ